MVTYRPEVDGLRAAAILPVVLFHAGVTGFSGGFVGVDVFFVISGFLITRIILRELEAGSFSLLDFYERRARRILPALFAMLIGAYVAGWLILTPDEFVAFAKSSVATALFGANVWFWIDLGDYFSQAAEFAPLLHGWSLAVEEQFYIAFPLLLMALARWRLTGRADVVVALCCLASFALAAVAVGRFQSATFYLPVTRAWELGLGALVACRERDARSLPRLAREALAAAGLATILASVLLYDRSMTFPGPAALPPVLGAAALIWACGGGATATGRLLQLRALVLIGLISYPLYLWHWPILAYLRVIWGVIELPGAVAAAGVAGAFVMAILSATLIEPAFRKRAVVGRRAVFAISGAGFATVAAVAAAVLLTAGAPQRIPDAALAQLAAVSDSDPRGFACSRAPVADCLVPVGAAEVPADFAVWGDSFAAALLPGVERAAVAAGRAGLHAARTGCSPLLGVTIAGRGAQAEGCAAFNAAMLQAVLDRPEIGHVVLISRWAVYAGGVRPFGEPGGAVLLQDAAGARAARPADNAAIFAAGLERTVDALRAAGRTVTLVGGVPEIGWSVPHRLYAQARWGVTPPTPAPSAADVAARNAGVDAVMAALAARGAVALATLAPAFCDKSGPCRLSQAGVPMYYDGSHITATAARTVAAPQLAAALWGVRGPIDAPVDAVVASISAGRAIDGRTIDGRAVGSP